MRLRDYTRIIKEALPKIESVRFTAIGHSFRCTNVQTCRAGFMLLEEIKLWNNINNENKRDNVGFILSQTTNDIDIDSQRYSYLSSFIRESSSLLKLFLSLSKDIIEEEGPLTLAIKLPEDIENLKSLETFVKDFNIACRFLSLSDNGNEPKFQGLESGSSWIAIAFFSEKILEVFLDLIKKSAEIRTEFYKGSHYKSMYELADIKQRELLAELDKKSKDKKIAELTVEIKAELNDNSVSSEIDATISRSITTMVGLIDRGMEVRTAVSAPDKIKQISIEIKHVLEKQKIGINYDVQKTIEEKRETPI